MAKSACNFAGVVYMNDAGRTSSSIRRWSLLPSLGSEPVGRDFCDYLIAIANSRDPDGRISRKMRDAALRFGQHRSAQRIKRR